VVGAGETVAYTAAETHHRTSERTGARKGDDGDGRYIILFG